jgi:tetratricopeptide (TPR) repeat protein
VRDDMARVQAAMGLSEASVAASEFNHAARWNSTARAIAGHLPADTSLDIALRYREVRVAAWKNDIKECVQLGEENLRIAEAAKIESADVNATMISLARCYSSLEQRDKAVAYLERVLPLTKKLNGYYDQQTASTLSELGVQARRAGEHDKALRYYAEALAVREHIAGPEDPDCAAVHNNIANVYRDLKRYDEARASLKRALQIFQKAYGPNSPAVAAAISGMGRIAMAEGNPAVAEPLFRQAVAIVRKKREPGHPDLLGDVALLAESLLAMKKPEAIGLFEEVLAGTEKDGDATDGDKAYARFWAARARVELGIHREGALELAETSCKALDQKDWQSDHTACVEWLAAHATK